MGGDMCYEIGQNAYIKLVLQALNHKTSAVNGLLLGRLSAYNNDIVEITESVPLFHSQIDLLPPLEIALIQPETNNRRISYSAYEHKQTVGSAIENEYHVTIIPLANPSFRQVFEEADGIRLCQVSTLAIIHLQ
ncbi:ER membrane protein complex subunit 8/9 homolog [Rhododendron vialii]|uniref:ER membrane protein complex subunit 8/9 homolog n=1 Tax=Rhododendron vialii TaxID=182163 RepID=UPI00265D7B6C|nr:ER membrane protein complex subunit 8/9 homolog [Rhododendron vialii]